MNVLSIGVLLFGVVIGYITYRTLIRTTANTAITDLATVVGAVGGGVVAGLIEPGTELFGYYGIGLAAGFVLYAAGFALLNGSDSLALVMDANEPSGESLRSRRKDHDEP